VAKRVQTKLTILASNFVGALKVNKFNLRGQAINGELVIPIG
jgi:hypothetical protein